MVSSTPTPPSRLVILATLHDNEARLYSMINNYLSKILELFPHLIVCCTIQTHPKIISLLEKFRITLITTENSRVWNSYHLVMEEGLKRMQNSDYFLYIDFDRLLHWFKTYPGEFQELFKTIPQDDYLLIGRTPRAIATHPQTQVLTESRASWLASQVFKLSPSMDWIGACWCGTYSLLQRLLTLRITTSTGFYILYSVALWNWAKTKRYIEVEGQEWETPDRFQNEIAQVGYESWVLQFQTLHEWKRRIALMDDCFQELLMYTTVNLEIPN